MFWEFEIFGDLDDLDFRKLHRGHRGAQSLGRPAGEWMVGCEGAVWFLEKEIF